MMLNTVYGPPAADMERIEAAEPEKRTASGKRKRKRRLLPVLPSKSVKKGKARRGNEPGHVRCSACRTILTRRTPSGSKR
ncbi:hypothetical protein SPACI_009610 [Sporomusa acidovorans DSM 3132]|uniref:Uncharacterized protein n=1 Tax=Sporomusa acidovorans (strain ATCC 49682 / DSM 3132 / Mol) TaxID=1123286 RepID=A0ABZ3IZ45_SPOA4|nr:hypothetical protein SPACI_37160 [Sporomusa acidovorans DSM 3132]SDE12805.1 zinc finger domain-containing protein, LSD1 subclass [Sporomusa acidovorans]